VVMELAPRLGLEVAEVNLTRYDVMTAAECFLTGTAAEVTPIRELDGRVIGAGVALQIVEVFLGTGFEGGRHQRRAGLIEPPPDRQEER